MEATTNKSYATLLHLSALSQYFIPFGGFILPIILWTTKKESNFMDHHGKQVINFQLSVFLYSLLLAMIAIPVLLFTVFKNVSFESMANGSLLLTDFTPAKLTGVAVVAIVAVVLFVFLKIAEFFLIICGAVMAANGTLFRYPLTINFIRSPSAVSTEAHNNSQPSNVPDQDRDTGSPLPDGEFNSIR